MFFLKNMTLILHSPTLKLLYSTVLNLFTIGKKVTTVCIVGRVLDLSRLWGKLETVQIYSGIKQTLQETVKLIQYTSISGIFGSNSLVALCICRYGITP